MRTRFAGRRGPSVLFAVLGLALGLGADQPEPMPTSPSMPSTSAPDDSIDDVVGQANLETRVRELKARVEELSRRVEQLPSQAAGRPRPASAPGPRLDSPAPVENLRLKAVFGPGFELKTADDEYQIQVHNLLQFDGRVFQQGGQNPVHDTFDIPREWFILSGRMTKPYEYFVALAHGFESVSLLDAYLNFHFDDRLQFKVGRYFVPFSFEPYFLPVPALITPEFSLFFNNFELNRSLGAMVWGKVAKRRIDYAAGVFNGSRNAQVDTHDSKEFIGFVNIKPFLESKDHPLENLNLGGSVEFGDQSNDPSPRTLRTVVPLPGNATIGVPFLSFNNNVRESGARVLWSLHAAYYYRHLSLIGEWDAGSQEYSLSNGPFRSRVPVESFFVEAGYFLTGETVASRAPVKPLRPFDLRKGKRALGAFELGSRYNQLNIGDQIFTRGLADPNLWTNRVFTTDLGVNWYLNENVKVAIFWEHAEFAAPVLYRPGARQLTSDLFLLRLQLRF